MVEGLVWPPRKEDLERMYLEEKLTAAMIAKVYDLKYKNPKVAESTVLYQLRRNGIARRDRAEHVRKVTPQMVDDWVRRYLAGESLKQIAGLKVNPGTVWVHLRRRGVPLRKKVDALIKTVTKYERKRFNGNRKEEAYLVGFAKGDCQVIEHGRAVRVRTSTTHRAMASLFENLFGSYGKVKKYARKSALVGFEWSLEVDLDASFRFLLRPVEVLLEDYLQSQGTLFSLAGFADAEGSIHYHKKRYGGNFELTISNTNSYVLERLQTTLSQFGYHSNIRRSTQDPRRFGRETFGQISRLTIWRRSDLVEALGRLKFRHEEKVAKKEICLSYNKASGADALRRCLTEWSELIQRIKHDRDAFVLEAKENLRIARHTSTHTGFRASWD